ncbi:GrpB family protein [Alkalicaulis satelles]|uniref:GrpB family protein n=1 Tax=Alkalicaulis satelles TaxID=2609175 RepID=A0A5M6ZDU0_9PROT|nr:GrpB family protein [Alkalicaulis satelles]KAA5802390.1 GrpB family protein [Alkalicaulis satelles]
MKKDPVDVAPPDPAWIEEGHEWAERVAGALKALALRVDHVGSTAVPELAAKNVIDIQALVVRLDEPEAVIAAMSGAGFRHAPDNTSDIPHADAAPVLGADDWRKLFFREPKGCRRVHVHVRRNGAAAARRTFLMRDYLRADPAARRDYGAFKLALADKTKKDRAAYQAIKSPFIETVMRAAEGWAELSRWTPGAPDAYWRSEG